MKKFLITLAFLAASTFAVQAQAAPPLSNFHNIASSWTAPISWNGTGASVPCSATVTTFCVVGYTETFTPPVGVTGTNTLTTTGTSQTFTPGGALYCGTWGTSVVVNWLDGSGTAAVSAPLAGTVVVACPFNASPATGLKNTVS